jgi:hypothetical protein
LLSYQDNLRTPHGLAVYIYARDHILQCWMLPFSPLSYNIYVYTYTKLIYVGCLAHFVLGAGAKFNLGEPHPPLTALNSRASSSQSCWFTAETLDYITGATAVPAMQHLTCTHTHPESRTHSHHTQGRRWRARRVFSNCAVTTNSIILK